MTVETIIEWADRKINEQTDNDIFFDLSTAGTKRKIVDFLSERVSWNYNDTEIRSLLLSYYKEYLKENSDRWLDIEKELIEYFNLLEYDNSNESTEDFLYYLSDDWYLREEFSSGCLPMPNYLTENLSRFKVYDRLKELLKGQGLKGYEV